ncbi:MAG: hypothetical protein WA190_03215 [Usitatibacter sp.]
MKITNFNSPSISTQQLLRASEDPSYSDHERIQALVEVGRRMHIEFPPTPTAREVLDEVWRDERVPIEIRLRAARVLLPPVGKADTTKETKQ